MNLKNLKKLLRLYGPTAFIVAGLAVVGLTVIQIQSPQFSFGRASGPAREQTSPIWFEPQTAVVSENGTATVRLKLASIDQPMTRARAVFNYDPAKLQIISITPGSLFAIQNQSTPGQVAIISEGSFLGTGTWAKVNVRLTLQTSASLTADPDLTSFAYEDGSTQSGGELLLNINY